MTDENGRDCDQNELIEAPDSFVLTGYNWDKGVREFIKYMWMSLECFDQSIRDAKDLGIPVTNAQTGPFRARILQQMANVQDILTMHYELDQLMQSYGVAPITDERVENTPGGGASGSGR